eukprot:gene9941-11772_t
MAALTRTEESTEPTIACVGGIVQRGGEEDEDSLTTESSPEFGEVPREVASTVLSDNIGSKMARATAMLAALDDTRIEEAAVVHFAEVQAKEQARASTSMSQQTPMTEARPKEGPVAGLDGTAEAVSQVEPGATSDAFARLNQQAADVLTHLDMKSTAPVPKAMQSKLRSHGTATSSEPEEVKIAESDHESKEMAGKLKRLEEEHTVTVAKLMAKDASDQRSGVSGSGPWSVGEESLQVLEELGLNQHHKHSAEAEMDQGPGYPSETDESSTMEAAYRMLATNGRRGILDAAPLPRRAHGLRGCARFIARPAGVRSIHRTACGGALDSSHALRGHSADRLDAEGTNPLGLEAKGGLSRAAVQGGRREPSAAQLEEELENLERANVKLKVRERPTMNLERANVKLKDHARRMQQGSAPLSAEGRLTSAADAAALVLARESTDASGPVGKALSPTPIRLLVDHVTPGAELSNYSRRMKLHAASQPISGEGAEFGACLLGRGELGGRCEAVRHAVRAK